MAIEDLPNPIASNPSPNPRNNDLRTSQASNSCNRDNEDVTPSPVDSQKRPKEIILSVALNIASQPLQNTDPDVWAVLTAISDKARKRPQGSNMILTSDEHQIGRVVEDRHFIILSTQISAQHCKIYRKKIAGEDAENPSKLCTSIFVKDNSTNGTYINWEKLTKQSPEMKLHHGDIISFSAPPHHELAYAFVFRELDKHTSPNAGLLLKRKAEEHRSWHKRQRGIGLGASEGPISLDDFRCLQRSNTELRKQLEDNVKSIDALQTEVRAAVDRHETEKKELRDSVSKSYTDQLNKLNHVLESKQKELAELNKISAEQKHAMEDLNIRLSASMQSCNEANEIIDSQKASILELETLLDEERELRREEREKADMNLKTSIQKVQAESQEEMRRLSDAASKREKEQKELIHKLQESEKERSSLVVILRSKLDDTRQKLVNSENKIRQQDIQICEEQRTSASCKKTIEELEQGMRKLRKELEDEKAAREEAWAKVSALELEMSAAMRDLDFERRKLKAARERIMLRETQLRSFYSTTEEISILFAKQQEQLKTMQRTLEDEEQYDNISLDLETNVDNGNLHESVLRGKEVPGHHNNITAQANSGSGQRCRRDQVDISSDEASVTEKHDCDNRGHGSDQDTQEAEFTSAGHVGKGGFGSDIDGVGTAPIIEGDTVGTERVFETESGANDGDKHLDLNKLAGETMQIDDDTLGQEAERHVIGGEISHQSASNNLLEAGNTIEDTERTFRTTDLLASEVAGSWAYNTGPSIHGENDSPRSKGCDEAAEALIVLHDSEPAAESQIVPSSEAATIQRNHEHQALSTMIGIVAPDLKDHFGGVGNNCDKEGSEKGVASNSDTEDCTDNEEVNAMDTEGVVASDAETEGSDGAEEAFVEVDEETEPDSVG
ncbi:hypothetical protein DCAR_0207763 [Daucus carota subsp. sativus]|uniref:FHA domain-containing protein n=1 Tax=Daucus carota subsp. sativus TaxID=79200 RepID=A0AAF1AMT7_DAUCS|nr:PREDICTED: myosin-2 heavy chain isoform X2 [Daucus carota subsp. sativus]WOG88528.1 hypothetical protein DCAR_0207763 [Daucus carota subsp. sativus]